MQDLVVVGGGLVGCSFALALSRHNPDLKISIIERQKFCFENNQQGWDNKIYAITPHNYQYLTENLKVKLDESRLGLIDTMKVFGGGNHNNLLEFDRSLGKSPYLAKIVEYRNLHQAVIAQLANYPNVQFCHWDIHMVLNADKFVSVTSESGEQISARLLVAADGANSGIRKRFDFRVEQIPYYQSGVVANFACGIAHANVAYQWFSGDGVLAYLPLADNKISMVWSTDNPQQLLNASRDELCQLVAAGGDHQLGRLELLTAPIAFPLKLNLVQQFYQQRVILIGDAAHTIHPLAGQGLNLGFGDAWELAELLAKLDWNNYTSQTLLRFNYTRLAEVRKMQMTCHLLQRLFHNRLAGVAKLRNLGFNLLHHLPILKQALISSAINY